MGQFSETSSHSVTGSESYNPFVLAIYDLYVLGISNHLIWRCPTQKIIEFYNTHLSANHLDVGVGTGYFLDKCKFPTSQPRIALLDLNPNSLSQTAQRIKRYTPSTHQANVLDPINLDIEGFDSIALNYLLHCLPGTMTSKHKVFAQLKPLLNDGGTLFGTTILGQGLAPNFVAKRLMGIYNKRGIFSNTQDNLEDLERGLADNFKTYSTHIVGNVAFFIGQN
jgi:ubiquinone/menaquinone biosynthesis C-methylase UbiE